MVLCCAVHSTISGVLRRPVDKVFHNFEKAAVNVAQRSYMTLPTSVCCRCHRLVRAQSATINHCEFDKTRIVQYVISVMTTQNLLPEVNL